MIDFLESRKLINVSTPLYNIDNYTKYMASVNTYLQEIPANFMSLEFDRNKKEKIKKHLEEIYNAKDISNEKIDIALTRVMNLIIYVNAGNRSNFDEDFEGQQNYIQENWPKIKRCECCGKKFENRNSVSLEHVLPVSLGGNDDSSNWQLLCQQCNGDKGNHYGLNDYQWTQPIAKHSLFGKSFEDQFDILKIKKTKKKREEKIYIAVRYFILERDNRSCTNCNNAKNRQLYVCATNINSMLSLESFRTLCETCVKKKSIIEKFKL